MVCIGCGRIRNPASCGGWHFLVAEQESAQRSRLRGRRWEAHSRRLSHPPPKYPLPARTWDMRHMTETGFCSLLIKADNHKAENLKSDPPGICIFWNEEIDHAEKQFLLQTHQSKCASGTVEPDNQMVPKTVTTIWLQGNMKAYHVQGGKCLLCTWFSFWKGCLTKDNLYNNEMKNTPKPPFHKGGLGVFCFDPTA